MELESLKYVWHSLEVPPAEGKDRRELLALLQKRSRGPVASMTRNLIGEAIAMVIAYVPAIVGFLLAFKGRLAAISWLFLVVLAVFFAYYYRKYRLLRDMQCPACRVRSNLSRQVARLKKYTGFYLLAGTITIPVTYLITYLIMRWRPGPAGPPYLHRLHSVPYWASPGFFLLLLVPLTIGMYYANAWYIHKLYGRHIKKLQDLLFEMDAE
ncbi:MAG TPA: hypothetical protein VGR89_08035 [Puia sp.]|nr:hypothetical protein [Puia sp.]